MPWIYVIDEAEAQGPLAALYAKMIEPWGGVDNIMKIHSINPPSLRAHYELYKTVMHRKTSELTRVQREMIAVAVSAINKCHY